MRSSASSKGLPSGKRSLFQGGPGSGMPVRLPQVSNKGYLEGRKVRLRLPGTALPPVLLTPIYPSGVRPRPGIAGVSLGDAAPVLIFATLGS
jgi:hypothetical protein